MTILDDTHLQDTTARERIIAALDALLAERGLDKTICPSEIARRVVASTDQESAWRAWMQSVRDVVGELASAGVIETTQRGARVDIHSARGPVRIGRAGAQTVI